MMKGISLYTGKIFFSVFWELIAHVYIFPISGTDYPHPSMIIELNAFYFPQNRNENISNHLVCGNSYPNNFMMKFLVLNHSVKTFCTNQNVSLKIDNQSWIDNNDNRLILSPIVHISPGKRPLGFQNCFLEVQSKLTNITYIESELFRLMRNRSVTLLQIQADDSCNFSKLSLAGIEIGDSKWKCQSNYTLNDSNPSSPFCQPDYFISIKTTSLVTSNNQSTKVTAGNASHVGFSNRTQNSANQSVFIRFWSVKDRQNLSQVHITEADRVINFIMEINNTVLCSGQICYQPYLDISFSSNTNSNMSLCKRTGRHIPSWLLGRVIVNGIEIEENTCAVQLSNFSNLLNEDKSNVQLNLKAMMNHKYDGIQNHQMIINVKIPVQGNGSKTIETLVVPVVVENKDKKATCQSINDPHLTSFDGLQFNNFYEGEFIFYQHQILPFKVHVIYQKCSVDVQASCNCGVAVQTGDDVIVFEKCAKEKLNNLSDLVRQPTGTHSTEYEIPMKVQLFLNGILTKGTSIYQEADGKKYYVFLPHGTYVKVIASGPMLNVWVVPSPKDIFMTSGLCGFYDWDKNNDLKLRNGSALDINNDDYKNLSGRIHPHEFLLDWRVDIDSSESLFSGVRKLSEEYSPPIYCECSSGTSCRETFDVEFCDVYKGKNITKELLKYATRPLNENRLEKRKVRSLLDKSPLKEPILINKKFSPPRYIWMEKWNNEVANSFCRQYIMTNYSLGQLCKNIKSVDFEREITSCMEDIKITGGTTWADSARAAMKEQCLEETQRDPFLPANITEKIMDKLCINDCSNRGTCTKGACVCDLNHASSDCSVDVHSAPLVTEIPSFGLCDVRYMTCSNVIVYGRNFINGPNLTCHLQDCKVNVANLILMNSFTTVKALLRDFNSVVCKLPQLKSYLIRISNNGLNTSKPLLFVPYDSACTTCNVHSTTCEKKPNSCIIDEQCYEEGQSSPTDECLICKAVDDEFQWTTTSGGLCRKYDISDWVVAGMAAVAGSLIGSLVGFLLYKYCCKVSKSLDSLNQSFDDPLTDRSFEFLSIPPNVNSNLLHRDHRPPPIINPALSADFMDSNKSECSSLNEIDSSTYF